MRPVAHLLPAGLAIALLGAATPAAAAAPRARRSPARYDVAYTGAGTWRTVYHSEPANPGGAPDHNAANDSSRQRWSLRFRSPLVVDSVGELVGAAGTTAVVGTVDHRHLDGLFAFDNASERCTVQATTPLGSRLTSVLTVRRAATDRALVLTAENPVADALNLLPAQCPGQGDSLDGLLDEYFTPGFSFAPGFGPARWFTPRSVSIGIAALARARRIRIHLGPTPRGTPPRDCAVRSPTTEHCSVVGGWRGTLTLVRR